MRVSLGPTGGIGSSEFVKQTGGTISGGFAQFFFQGVTVFQRQATANHCWKVSLFSRLIIQ